MLKTLLCFAFLLFSFSSQAALPNKKPVVFVKKALKAELFDTLNYPARVEAKINATILSETDGLVTKVPSSIGSSVNRNSTILVVQQTDPVFRYAPVSVKSPIAGFISQLEVSEGARVSKGQKLASVTNPSSIKITVEVPAQDLDYVKAGMEAQMPIPGSDEVITLKVKGVSPVIDPATGTATAEFEAAQPKMAKSLRPGLISRLSMKANSRNGISVPEDALIYRENLTYLRVIRNGVAKRVEVKLGRKSRGRVEITSGVDEGAEVIERASGYINDGDAVEVQAGEEAQG